MGAFIIIFSGIFAYFTRFRREWYFFISLILIGLFSMAFYTYSRSALLALVLAYIMVLVMSLSSLWRAYRSQFITTLVILTLFAGVVGVLNYDRSVAIVGRS